jgi:hypothetical protein
VLRIVDGRLFMLVCLFFLSWPSWLSGGVASGVVKDVAPTAGRLAMFFADCAPHEVARPVGVSAFLEPPPIPLASTEGTSTPPLPPPLVITPYHLFHHVGIH